MLYETGREAKETVHDKYKKYYMKQSGRPKKQFTISTRNVV